MNIKKIKLSNKATKEEIEFIEVLHCNIARDADEVKLKAITKAEKRIRLKGYIRSCNRRFNWDFIDKAKCEAYAQELLSQL